MTKTTEMNVPGSPRVPATAPAAAPGAVGAVGADPGAPVSGPGSGRRPRRPGEPGRRRARVAPERWPGGAHDPSGQAWRLLACHHPGTGPGEELRVEQARAAITAARAVYAAYHQLAVVLGVDAVPAPDNVRAQAGFAAARAVYGADPPAPRRYGLRAAMTRAGLLP